MNDTDEVIPSEGERFVYLVRSASNPSIRRRVDLTAFNGAGQCACPDWPIKRLPNILAGMPIGTRRTLCKHGILARRFLMNAILTDAAKAERQER